MRLNRRQWMFGSAAMAASNLAAAGKTVAVASSNGLRACAKAVEVMKSGGDTLDAAIAGVNINEEDPDDTSVGYGGLPNEEGIVELDASVMHGPTRRAGSVASLRNIKTPSKIARLVMEQTRMVQGVWLPRFAQINLSVKVLLFGGGDFNKTIEWSDYKHFSGDVKDYKIDAPSVRP